MQWTFLPVQENSSYDIPLLLPVHLSLARQSEHFLQQPENQWSQVLDKKICRCCFCSYDRLKWLHSDIFLTALRYASSVVWSHLPCAYLRPLPESPVSDQEQPFLLLSARLLLPIWHLPLSVAGHCHQSPSPLNNLHLQQVIWVW